MIDAIQVIPSDPDTLPGTYIPPPMQNDPGAEPVPPDPSIYNSPLPYPPFLARNGGTGTMRGIQLGSVEIAPIQYIGASQQVIVFTSVQVNLTATAVPATVAVGIRERLRPGMRFSRRRHELQWLVENVLNPEMLFSNYP
jgi:hypothetical protein